MDFNKGPDCHLKSNHGNHRWYHRFSALPLWIECTGFVNLAGRHPGRCFKTFPGRRDHLSRSVEPSGQVKQTSRQPHLFQKPTTCGANVAMLIFAEDKEIGSLEDAARLMYQKY